MRRAREEMRAKKGTAEKGCTGSRGRRAGQQQRARGREHSDER
tara:strand:- start:12840 stop:12968 length:129 start_codon:yes stop_codon:yes gene_type:complete